jgi:cellulose synthase/poly-beta-1,6-N-acetylglucosamine synthase-like glycosyltransferase
MGTKKTAFCYGIGIPCHNEAQNIGQLLERLCLSSKGKYLPEKIVVLSSASTDGTDQIVRCFVERSEIPVALKTESRRNGKSAAVNKIIQEFKDVDINILMGADVQPDEGCLDKLLEAFRDPEVGVAGGLPIPEGPMDNHTVKISCLLWELHHLIAQSNPKTTEITVFRNTGKLIDDKTLVDEAELERVARSQGYRIQYVPTAIIRVQAPLLLRDYFRQRMRVTLGHMILAKEKRYFIETLSIRKRCWALWSLWREKKFPLLTAVLAGILEIHIYLLASIQKTLRLRDRPVWPMIKSAKRSFKIGEN